MKPVTVFPHLLALPTNRSQKLMEYCTIPLKTCTKCNRLLPATTFFFHKNPSGKYGLRSQCKPCYLEINNPRALEWFRNNKDYSHQQSHEWRQKNSEYDKERKRQWYHENADRVSEQAKLYNKANRARLRIKLREYRQSDPRKYKRITQEYYQNNKDVFRAQKLRRRAKQKSLPSDFTAKQLSACLEYFNHCCAVCGKQLRDLFGDVIPHIDHWIPLANPECPGTVVENMVCLCNNCNLTKSAKEPYEWLCQEFGKYKAKIILSKIESYFEWARKRTGE